MSVCGSARSICACSCCCPGRLPHTCMGWGTGSSLILWCSCCTRTGDSARSQFHEDTHVRSVTQSYYISPLEFKYLTCFLSCPSTNEAVTTRAVARMLQILKSWVKFAQLNPTTLRGTILLNQHIIHLYILSKSMVCHIRLHLSQLRKLGSVLVKTA